MGTGEEAKEKQKEKKTERKEKKRKEEGKRISVIMMCHQGVISCTYLKPMQT
jgi:hypothetical protein